MYFVEPELRIFPWAGAQDFFPLELELRIFSCRDTYLMSNRSLGFFPRADPDFLPQAKTWIIHQAGPRDFSLSWTSGKDFASNLNSGHSSSRSLELEIRFFASSRSLGSLHWIGGRVLCIKSELKPGFPLDLEVGIFASSWSLNVLAWAGVWMFCLELELGFSLELELKCLPPASAQVIR